MSDTKEIINSEEAAEETALTEKEEAIKEAEETESTAEAEEKAPEAAPVSNNKKSKKLPVIALIIVAVIAVAAIAFCFSGGSKVPSDPVFFFSDGALYMKDIDSPKSKEIKICDGDETWDTLLMLNSDATEFYFTVSKELSDEAFIENGLGTSATLYRYSLLTPDTAPTVVAENVIDYVYDEASDCFYYIADGASELTKIDAEKNKEVISSDVVSFTLSADGQTLFYTLTDEKIYFKENGKDAVLASEKGSVQYSDENLSFIYVLDDGAFYKITPDGEKTLIDSSVISTNFSAADGYYFKTVNNWLLKDIFEDDMAEADNEIKIPTDTDSEAYKLYSERLARDNIRTYILDPEQSFSVQEVYYYNGSESKKVLENAVNAETSFVYGAGDEFPTCLFCSVVDRDNFKKIRMSDLWASVSEYQDDLELGIINDIYELITDPLVNYSTDYFVYKDNPAYPIGLKEVVYDVIFDEANKALYITTTTENEASFNSALYKLALTDTGLSEAELICENASDVYLTKNGKIFYLEEITLSEDDYNYHYNAYLDSELIVENISYLSEFNYDANIAVFETYQLNEDGTPNYELYSDDMPLVYNLESSSKASLDNDTYFFTFETPDGKILILQEGTEFADDFIEDDSEYIYNVYLIEDGKLTDLKLVLPDLSIVHDAGIYREGINYNHFDSDDDFADDFILGEGLDLDLGF